MLTRAFPVALNMGFRVEHSWLQHCCNKQATARGDSSQAHISGAGPLLEGDAGHDGLGATGSSSSCQQRTSKNAAVPTCRRLTLRVTEDMTVWVGLAGQAASRAATLQGPVGEAAGGASASELPLPALLAAN